MKGIKLKDIAERFNVSVSTVSKAISGYSDIRNETKKKIGMKESLIRLSIGIEDPDDLINDINNSLEEV